MMSLYFLADGHDEYTIYVTCKSNRKPDTKKKLIGSTYPGRCQLHEKKRNVTTSFGVTAYYARSTRSISGIYGEAAAHMAVIASQLGLA